MESKPQINVSRRHLLGLGAAAGAVTVAGMTTHLPFASAADGDAEGVGVSSRQVPNYTAVTKVAGLQSATLGYADFVAISNGTNNGLQYADPPSVYNQNGTGGVAASLRLAVGSVLRQVDFFGYRDPAASGNLTFTLYKSTLPTSASRTTVVSQTLTGSGEVQGSFVLSPGQTVSLGDVYTLEASSTSSQLRVAGAIYQYAQAGGIYVPIAPRRVHDSRQGGTKIVANETRKLSIANEITANGGAANVVPPGATGIAYNLTITATESSFGYLTVVAGGGATSGPSSINWDRINATLANGLQGPLNDSREISVFCGGDANAKTHFLVDVLGYYL